MEKATNQLKKIKAHVGKMDAKINRWGAKLDLLATQADNSEAVARSAFYARIDALILKHRAARSKLEELRGAGSERFEVLSKALDTFWNDLEAAIKDLTARFKDALSKG